MSPSTSAAPSSSFPFLDPPDPSTLVRPTRAPRIKRSDAQTSATPAWDAAPRLGGRANGNGKGKGKVRERKVDRVDDESWRSVESLLSRTFQLHTLSTLFNVPLDPSSSSSALDYPVLASSLLAHLSLAHASPELITVSCGPALPSLLPGAFGIEIESPSLLPPVRGQARLQKSLYVFLPSALEEEEEEEEMRRWPVLMEKAATPALGQLVREWVEKRFDARVGRAGVAVGKGVVEGFVEGVWARMAGRDFRTERRPLDLGFSLPPPISPSLSLISLSVPLSSALQLSTPPSAILLPLFAHLTAHTGLPLSRIPLVRAGLAGVFLDLSAGAAKVKVYPLREGKAEGERVEGERRWRGWEEREEEERWAEVVRWLVGVLGA